MKKNKVLSGFLILILTCSYPRLAFSNHATVLSDEQLDSVHAGGFPIDINAAYAFRSAVISQSNIAAVACINSINNKINNSNLAIITSRGNSAVAAQSNIAAVMAQYGNIKNAQIDNVNVAAISNIAVDNGMAKVSSLETGGLEINNVAAQGSAVASQSNIACMVAMAGNIADAVVNNLNVASVNNCGNSAAAVQTNIALVLARGDIEGVRVANTNAACVDNTVNGIDGLANVKNIVYNGMWGKNNNYVCIDYSAIAKQSNIAILISLGGTIKNGLVKNINIAQVKSQNTLP